MGNDVLILLIGALFGGLSMCLFFYKKAAEARLELKERVNKQIARIDENERKIDDQSLDDLVSNANKRVDPGSKN